MDEAFRRFGPVVGRKALRILGRRDEADDLVQDVFMAAHRRAAALREPQALLAWLLVTAVRLARRRLQTRRLRQFLHLDQAGPYEAIVDRATHPAERLLAARLYRALDRLPVEARLAWTLRRVDDEPIDRVAALCGCSVATAKRRIAAAETWLEKEVGE
jgi:RNA polymerase sigma-70 factor (ECF subfamily)